MLKYQTAHQSTYMLYLYSHVCDCSSFLTPLSLQKQSFALPLYDKLSYLYNNLIVNNYKVHTFTNYYYSTNQQNLLLLFQNEQSEKVYHKTYFSCVILTKKL